MTTIKQPNVTLNIVGADADVPNTAQRVLFIGQQTVTATATSGALQQTIGNGHEENGLFGQRSDVAGMVRTARANNTVTRFDAIGLDDAGAAAAAAGVVAFTGTATEAGSITVNVGSRGDHSYVVGVAVGDTATVVGDALVALITADADAPFTAANVTGTVTITAANGGTLGNLIGLEDTGTVAGVTVALTAFAGGTTDPVLTGLFDAIEGERYQTIVWSSVFDIDTVKDFLDGRFNVSNDILDGVAVMSITDTHANLKSTANGHSSQNLVIHANRAVTATDYEGSALFELDNKIAATIAALRSLRLTDGAVLTGIITATASLDQFGGPAIASLPYFNTRARLLPTIDVGQGFNAMEIEELADAGAFVLGNNRGRTDVIMGELVTTYKTDIAGNPDISYKFLNSVDTMSGVREYMVNNLRSTYGQHRLTEGATIPGHNMVNRIGIEATLVRLYAQLSGAGFVLTQAGQEAVTFFKQNMIVTIDMANGSVSASMKTPIVTQLRDFEGTVQIQFGLTL